jgi:hypothetical protein
MKQYGDHFSDVTSDLGGYGSLGGAGIGAHERTEAKVTQEGVNLHAHCDNCGVHNVVIAEWPELVFIAEGKLPPNGWKFEQGHVRTAIGCRGCRRELPIGVVPDEAGKWVRAGVSARYIAPNVVQHLASQARAVR